VAAASVYGVGEIELTLRRAYKGYVLGVTGQHSFWSWGRSSEPIAGTADEIAAALPASAWRRLSAGAGTKGPRWHDWVYLELATLTADAVDPSLDGSLWTRGLLVRRSLTDASLAFFTTWCPAGTPAETLVAVEGRRWAIEDAFEAAKTELGLDHNGTRSGAPLPTARLAPPRLAGDARLRHAGRGPSPGRRHTPKNLGAASVALVRWSIQEIRRVTARLAQRRIEPAFVIAWSAWRRAHQAKAQQAHLRRALQL
jgi:hypothetical protein